MTDFDVTSEVEKDRAMHAWMNKVNARLTEIEKRIGSKSTESFNDLSCRLGQLDHRLKKLEGI